MPVDRKLVRSPQGKYDAPSEAINPGLHFSPGELFTLNQVLLWR